MAEYDLTQRVAPFFDLHLVIPLLEFIQPRKIYDDESLYKTHRSVLLKTNMIDSVIEMYPEGQCPEELLKRRDEVLEEREQLKAKCDPVVKILELDEVKDIMESARDREGNSKVLEFIEQNHGFKLEMLEYLFKYAKFQYECGNYQAASICLDLNQEWTHAKDDLTKLKAYIDSDPFDTEVELLQHRAWLLHWALFCVHLLRYLAVAVVTSKNKQKNSLKDLIRVIDIEKTNYRDPVTDFLSSLYIDYDFDGAQQKLQDCEKVLENDFFLVGCVNDFRESARLLVFDMFCRIHQCISLDMLSSRLFMDQSVDCGLIRNYRIEGAKIDSDKKQVVMGVKPVSIHEQVMENTKRLTLRSQQMSLQLEKLKTEKKGVWKNEQSH
uniref:Eukaryotic translation initiation factor 3 subunit E n=1 Tax=Ditylenchus dipsaci TaxID=166011 RepID=A0A915ELX9_9BILA